MKWQYAFYLLAAISIATGLAFAQPLLVHTRSGSLNGVLQGQAEAFLGIPYAKAPTGNLRWRGPEPPVAWQGERDASHFSASCYQGPPVAFGPYTAEFLIDGRVSEDCLYLNVWTPHRHKSALPVLMFIHGGGFGSGSASIPIYNGSDLSSRGIVVVTINYRLGVFGYLARSDLTRESTGRTSGNYGILDMIAALRWIRDNISRFGGDPHNVTIAGQSAGAVAVNDLIASPQAAGLFAHAIAQSDLTMGLPMKTLTEAEHQGAELGAKLHADSIASLRALEAEVLMKATLIEPPPPGSKPRPMPPSFTPNLDNAVITADPNRPRAPIVSKVPLMSGFNYDEGMLFGGTATSATDFEAQVRERYGTFAERILAVYPHANDAEASRSSQDLARDRYMASLLMWSEARAQSSGQLVFNYLFDHPYPSAGGHSFGAFHTAEVPYVFGALVGENRPFDEADRQLSHEIQDYWISFCKTGRPGGVWKPVSESGDGLVMGLGNTRHERLAVSDSARLQVFRDYVAAGGMLAFF